MKNTTSNGIIIVDSYANILQKQSLEPLTTQVVSVNYANANTLARTVFNLLSFDCMPNAQGAAPAPTGGDSYGGDRYGEPSGAPKPDPSGVDPDEY